MRALVAGWFSFSGMGTTAGDLMARDVVCGWLEESGVAFDVALDPPFAGGVNWRTADPLDYDGVVFVCGPLGNGPPSDELFAHFAGRRLIGVDLSMLQSLEEWNPFELLLERDSSRAGNPDIAFASRRPNVPIAALVLVHPQKEYKTGAMHATANAALRRLTEAREVARLHVDTCLDPWNTTGLRTPAEIESVIAAADVVLTTRLHGTVLALKNGVPAVVVDPIAGGAKLLRQAQTIGWPVAFPADAATDQALAAAFDYCLTEEARAEARRCAERAVRQIDGLRASFVNALAREPKA